MTSIAQAFNTNKHVYLSGVIDATEANRLSDKLHEMHQNKLTESDPQCPLSDSIYNAPECEQLLHNLCAPLSAQIGIELEPAYCYARIYRPGEVLTPHTDREACEISGTMTLGHDPGSAIWPIFMGSDKTDNIGTSIKIEVGDMVLYHGCDLNHWRPEYKGQWQTQVFFHYVRKDGYNTNHAGDQARVATDSSITGLTRGASAVVQQPPQNPDNKSSVDSPEHKYLNKWIYQIGNHDNIFPGLTTVCDPGLGIGFTSLECEKIIKEYESDYSTNATIGDGGSHAINEEIRKVQEYNIDLNENNKWIFDRIGLGVSMVNAEYYKFDLTGITHGVSLLKYTGADGSHYTWHTDTGDGASSSRKISISIPLSKPTDYRGGDLIVNTNGVENTARKTQGSLSMFPSFCQHTVTPVTSGERWVIVVWVNGPRFK